MTTQLIRAYELRTDPNGPGIVGRYGVSYILTEPATVGGTTYPAGMPFHWEVSGVMVPDGGPAAALTAGEVAAVEALVLGGGDFNLTLLNFAIQDAYVIGATPPDYELDLTNIASLPAGVSATAVSLSSRGAYVSNANQVVRIALGTVLPALAATAWSAEVEYELDQAVTTAGNRAVLEFGGTTNNRHTLYIVQASEGTQTFGWANVSSLPGLDVKSGTAPATGLQRAGRMLTACSGTSAVMYAGALQAAAPTSLQAISGTLSLNLGGMVSLNSSYLSGWIKKARIWSSVVSAARCRAGTPIYADDITCWGDSLTQGSGASPASNNYPTNLALRMTRNVYNQGVSGESSTQILARFLAQADRVRNGVTVIWSGRNNPTVAATVVSDVQGMTSRLQDSRFVVLDVINKSDGTENAGSPAYNNIVAVNAALLAAFPNNYIPIRELLVAASGGENDAPAPDTTVDGLHLTSTWYDWVAGQVQSFITSKGW
jgi:lysophospholipase L1-like esterase